jgi:hypothetical protein
MKGLGDFSKYKKVNRLVQKQSDMRVGQNSTLADDNKNLSTLTIPKEFLNTSPHSSNAYKSTQVQDSVTKRTVSRNRRNKFLTALSEPRSAMMPPTLPPAKRARPNLNIRIHEVGFRNKVWLSVNFKPITAMIINLHNYTQVS